MEDILGSALGLGLGLCSELGIRGVVGSANRSRLDCSAVFPAFPLAILAQV